MLRLAAAPLLLAAVVDAQAGYTTDTDVAVYRALGTKLTEVKTAIERKDANESPTPDWAAAVNAYQADVDESADEIVSLANIGKRYSDVSPEYTTYAAYHGDTDYASNFVLQALTDDFHPRLPLSSDDGVEMESLPEVAAATAEQRGGPRGIAIKSRQEMTMKGVALQSLMMVCTAFLFWSLRLAGDPLVSWRWHCGKRCACRA